MTRAIAEPPLDLPPVFRTVTLRELGDAFAHAMAIGAEAGAGTLVWVRRFDLVEIAVVLEPDEPLAGARRVLYLGLNALADALAAHCPPEKSIEMRWPDALLLDRGLVGGGRIGWPEGAPEDAPPPFMVFGAMVRTFVSARAEAGDWLVGTSLETEGFEEIDTKALVESFARHLMVHVHEWQDRGFRRIGERWLARLPRQGAERRGLDVNGDLLVHRPRAAGEGAAAERSALLPLLARPTWLDPETGLPWL
ncbi:biotin/lipoate--protein ligase family protein [Prosthecomicrobium sp. N25]|uniref:biotin/lipoate--protein ligase family protein n=1 Tax=Prosthecomicrobium sp. N25 TaxID=3129254 RepID=UPI0030774411